MHQLSTPRRSALLNICIFFAPPWFSTIGRAKANARRPALSVSHKKCFTIMDFTIQKQPLSINEKCIGAFSAKQTKEWILCKFIVS